MKITRLILLVAVLAYVMGVLSVIGGMESKYRNTIQTTRRAQLECEARWILIAPDVDGESAK